MQNLVDQINTLIAEYQAATAEEAALYRETLLLVQTSSMPTDLKQLTFERTLTALTGLLAEVRKANLTAKQGIKMVRDVTAVTTHLRDVSPVPGQKN